MSVSTQKSSASDQATGFEIEVGETSFWSLGSTSEEWMPVYGIGVGRASLSGFNTGVLDLVGIVSTFDLRIEQLLEIDGNSEI